MQSVRYHHRRGTTLAALEDAWAAERESTRVSLLVRIERAFADVRLGNGISLSQARALDDYESFMSAEAARELDPEQRWQDVSDEKLDRLSDALWFVDAEGYRFYIPRFMVRALASDGAPDSLAAGASIDYADLPAADERLALLSAEQREVLRAFTLFFQDLW